MTITNTRFVRIQTIGTAMVNVTRLEADSIVSESGWLTHVPKAFRAQLLQRAILVRFAADEPIFRFGDPAGGIYGLVAGTVTVNSAPPGTTPRLIHLGIPGAWAGEGSFMTGQPRRGELRALGETWMMHVPLDAMEEMADGDPGAVRAFGIISILNIDVLIRVVHDLQKRDASRRIASILQRAAWLGEVPIPLSQADIGIMANASRQQVNAAMQLFSEAGWLKHNYRSIVVMKPQALRQYSEDVGA
jgi:CRP-like cAMP-binding protein